jgi:mannose-6-phosphate isomerase
LPWLSPRPWGVRSLRPWLDVEAGDDLVGEAWYTDNRTRTPDGRSLGEHIASDAARVLGPAVNGTRCPLLMKLLFTSERLSIQVHPDDAYGQRHHGSLGKTEAWHVLSATPDAEIGLGLVAPSTPDAAREAAQTGALADMVDWRAAAVGDTFFVPAGTVHAIGGGLTIVEVQEHSDITYRLFDYGRPRDLHLDHGLAVATLDRYAIDNSPVALSPGRTRLVTCAYFTMERVRVTARSTVVPTGREYQLLMALEGTGTLAGEPFAKGDAWLVPAIGDAARLDTDDATFLLAYRGEAPSTVIR